MAIEYNLKMANIHNAIHVLEIQKSNYDELQWHIAKLPKPVQRFGLPSNIRRELNPPIGREFFYYYYN